MDAAVGHQRNLVVNALSDRQPVQRVTKYGSDVLVESSASDEARSGVQYGLLLSVLPPPVLKETVGREAAQVVFMGWLSSYHTTNHVKALLLFWHAPLGVQSTICRHQPPQRAVLGQVNCFIQCEVVGSQIEARKAT